MANKAQSDNTEEIKEFFDQHAQDYRTKYTGNDPFYQYFFFERMEAATDGLDFTDKRILDIGSGTGGLYDYLMERTDKFRDYVATDVSAGMLSASKVPEDRKLCGDFLGMNFTETFDYVFMLGVTTYMDSGTCRAYFKKIDLLLDSGGILIVTFTNKNSVDIMMRRFLNPIARLFAGRDRIISQKFETWYYSLEDMKLLLPQDMNIKRFEGLNHTVFPLSRLLPRVSIWVAKKIRDIEINEVKKKLSTDILLLAGRH